MGMNQKAIDLMDSMIENKEKLLETVFKNYKNQYSIFNESFELVRNKLDTSKIDLSERKDLIEKHEENFGTTICDSHLIERGFVDGHTNYEYEWYLHIDYEQKKKEYLELFINRVLIRTVNLSLLIKDYAEKTELIDSVYIDPNDFVEKLPNENYRELLGQILADSDTRIQSIIDRENSVESGPINHEYISHLFGGVSEKELIIYAYKNSIAADDYLIIAIDQKIDQILKILSTKGSQKELELLTAVGYLLDFYDINFELSQTSCKVASKVK